MKTFNFHTHLYSAKEKQISHNKSNAGLRYNYETEFKCVRGEKNLVFVEKNQKKLRLRLHKCYISIRPLYGL